MVKGFTTGLIMLLVFIGCLTGCTLPRLQEMKEYADVRAGKQAVLLLRLTSEDGSGKTSPTVVVGLGDFETGGELELAALRKHPISSPSHEAAEEGWIYFVLQPGVYYLGFIGPLDTARGPFNYIGSLKTAQRWSIDIPAGSRLIYGGSIHLLCRRVKRPLDITRCENEHQVGVLKNEESLAAKLALEHIPELGAPKTLLLQPHRGGPIVIKKPK